MHGSNNSASEKRGFGVVSVDAQGFIDAPGRPGGGQDKRDSISAGGEGLHPDGQIGVAGVDGEDFEGGVVIGQNLNRARDGLALGGGKEIDDGGRNSEMVDSGALDDGSNIRMVGIVGGDGDVFALRSGATFERECGDQGRFFAGGEIPLFERGGGTAATGVDMGDVQGGVAAVAEVVGGNPDAILGEAIPREKAGRQLKRGARNLRSTDK